MKPEEIINWKPTDLTEARAIIMEMLALHEQKILGSPFHPIQRGKLVKRAKSWVENNPVPHEA